MNPGSTSTWPAAGWPLQQRWIQRDPPAPAGLWGWLLPLLALAATAWWALASFAQQDIEATARHEMREALDAQGFGWARLSLSGQHARLTGPAPSEAAGQAALDAARAATCPTALGRWACAVEVVGAFDPAPAPTLAHTAPSAASAAAMACDSTFASVLAQAQLVFATSSAQLQPGSAAVLDELARVANGCPGTLRISGHTDNQGNPAANRALSRDRAETAPKPCAPRWRCAASRPNAWWHAASAPTNPRATTPPKRDAPRTAASISRWSTTAADTGEKTWPFYS